MNTAWRKIQRQIAKTIICCVGASFAAHVLAAPVIQIQDERIHIALPAYVDVFEDATKKIQFDDIKSEKYFNQFAPSSLTDLFFGYTQSAYWLRFSVENLLDHDQAFIFEVTPADIDFIDFFAVDYRLNKTLFHKHSGSSVDFEKRDYDHPLYYFDLAIPAHTSYTYYVRLESNKTINAQLKLSTPREHFYYSASRDWWQGFLLSALLILGLIHLSLAFAFKYKGFAYCGLVLFSMAFIQCSWNGYLFQFLHTNAAMLDRQLILSVYISMALSLLFARSYLNTHQRLPRVHRFLTLLMVICLVGIPCSWLFDSRINAMLVGLISVPTMFFVFGIAIYSFLESYEPAYYFLLARSITIIMVLMAIFSDRGLLPQSVISAWGLSGAMLFEGFVFMFAMVKQQLQTCQTEKNSSSTISVQSPQDFIPVSAFCHELRTPISGVMGMAELLLDTSLTNHQRLQVETIHGSGKALLDVVNKMSDLASLESGETRLSESAFELHVVVESCIENARNISERRNIELIYQVDESLSGFLYGDEEKLQQILSNLINYDIRHLESGEILLTAKSIASDAILFEVMSGKNTITQEYTTLYESQQTFTSADNLNLAIARQFVALMGGELLLQHRSDGGSRASFKINLRRQRRNLQIEKDDQLLRGKHLMIVDDNDTCCKIVKQQASHWGMEVVVANSGKEALALLRSQANLNKTFDLLLVDYDMPGMSGLDLVAKIKQDQDALNVQNTLIMILTGASKMPSQLMTGNLGVYQVLYKPLSGKSLKQALMEAFQNAMGGSDGE